MKTTRCFLTLVLLSKLAVLSARSHPADDSQLVAEEMVAAAKNLLATLTTEQAAKATYPLNDNERFNWHFIPRERKGLPLKEMTPEQKHLAHALLSTALSHRGYVKASTIMSLEEVLRGLEQGKGPTRDPELYFVTIFGKPDPKSTWGWRLEAIICRSTSCSSTARKSPSRPHFSARIPGKSAKGRAKGCVS